MFIHDSYLCAEIDDRNIKDYTAQLKSRYFDLHDKYVSESQWPPISTKFTKVSYIIHKPKRTAKETKLSIESAHSGLENLSPESEHVYDVFITGSDENYNKNIDSQITIKEEISDIFLHIDNIGKSPIILIEGAPGIGKTMLLIEIMFLWANEKLLEDKKVVLYLPLRKLKVNKIETVEDIFYYSCKDRKMAQIYANYFICNKGQGLAILLDGVDENLQAIQKETFLHRILIGEDIEEHIFNKACIIITSRPHATVELQKYVSCRIEIIGFTDANRCNFVEENLKENDEDSKKLKEYLQKSHKINTIYYIPLNMTILLFLFRENQKLKVYQTLHDTETESTQPELIKQATSFTQTELIEQAIIMTILHNLEKLGITGLKKDFKSLPKPYNIIFNYLCKLAYDGLNENKMIFTDEDINFPYIIKFIKMLSPFRDKVQKAVTNGLGLLQKAEFFADFSGDTKSLTNFAHSSIQDFLAAWYFTTFNYFSFYSQRSALYSNFWNGNYMNMWSFYVGLTRGEDFVFKHFLSGTSLCCCFCTQCRSFSISKHILDNKIKMIYLYFFLQEAPDSEIIEDLNIVETNKTLDISGQIINMKENKTDLELLGSILSKPSLTDKWDMVNLSSCGIDDESFEVLNSILTRNKKSPKIRDLLIADNDLKVCSHAIVNLVCSQKITKLNLSKNQLIDMNSFQKCGDFLVTLNISDNKIDDKRAIIFFEILKYFEKIKVLNLSHNNISDDQKVTDALGLALCQCNSLEVLYIHGNMIEDKAKLLSEVIDEIKDSESEVHYYRLTDKASTFLKILKHCDQIDYKPDSNHLRSKIMQSLKVNISYNGLTGDIGGLGQHLHLLVNLRVLDIAKNNISDDATNSLVLGMLLTPTLKEFKYDENDFSEDSIMYFNMIHQLRITRNEIVFKCAPSEIKALVYILNCINESQSKLQSSDIVSTIGLIKELNLSHSESTTLDYKITSKDINELCAVLTWFKQLKLLDIENNDISNEAREALAKIMLQICSLNDVKLLNNPIFQDELSMEVFDTIKRVRDNQVQSIVSNQKYPRHIQCQSIICIMGYLNQLDNSNFFKSFDNVTTLDIDSESVYANKFLEYLHFLLFLKKLHINNIACITDCGFTQLSWYLSQNITLTKLDLSFCNLENFNIENAPGHNTILKVLKFNYCRITATILHKLALNLLMFTNLHQFEVEGNYFGDKGISSLHDVLLKCNGTITALNLSNNQLTSNSAVIIAEFVRICKVKYLNISNNHLGSIFHCFEQCRIKTLEELNISANNHDAHTAVQFTKNISYLKSCSSLKKLNISKNRIDERAIDEMYCSFIKCIHLKEVICNENPAENEIEIAFCFVQSLHANTFSKNVFKCTPSKIKPLIFMLKHINEKSESSNIVSAMRLITELDLSNSDPTTVNYKLTSEDFKELCVVLPWFKNLKVLDVRYNDVTDKAKVPMATMMLQNCTLITLKLIGNPIYNDKISMTMLNIIKNLYENRVQSIVYNQNNSSHIDCCSVISIMEILNQLKNPNCCQLFNSITVLDIEEKSKLVSAFKFFENLHFLPFLKTLKINNVKCITGCGIIQLSNYLSLNTTLTMLDLSFCNLDIKSVPSNNTTMLKVLKFNYCGIKATVLHRLALNLLMFTDLNQFEIEGNCFGDEGISYLHDVLLNYSGTTITALNLSNNQLTSASAIKIVEILQMCMVKYLNISCNNLGSIFHCFELCTIKTLEELDISANNHDIYNVVEFAENISYLEACKSLRTLNISNNRIDKMALDKIYYSFIKCNQFKEMICCENPAENEIEMAFWFVQHLHSGTFINNNIFKCAPSKAKLLIITLNCISNYKEKLQSSDIVFTMSLITELHLSHNKPTELDYKVSSEDIKELCLVLTCFKHLKVLDLRNNNISDEATEAMTKAMLQICTLNDVILFENPICNDELSMTIFDIIRNVREKRLQSIINNSDNRSDIQCDSVIYIMECLNQLEDPNCFKSFDNIIVLDIDSKSANTFKFFEYLHFLPCLNTLKINNVTCIMDYGITELGKYFSRNITLTILDLSFCNLENLDFDNTPSHNTILKVLKLNKCRITATALHKLALTLLMFTNLYQFEIEGNYFGDKGIGYLNDVLLKCSGTTIAIMNLSNNQLTSISALKIAEIVQKCEIKYLYISYNYLRDIFRAFEQCTITMLEGLNISANNYYICNGRQFAESISYLNSCSNLKKLNISNNSIDKAAKDEILYSFIKCAHFKEVICNDNQAESEIKAAFNLIQDLHDHPSSVKSIEFSKFPKATSALISKVSLLHTNLTSAFITTIGQLKWIDFSFNSMTIDKTFIDFLQSCNQLEFLNMENNEISNATFKYLATGFLFTGKLSLPNLHLKDNPCMDNPKNEAVLKMIEILRSEIDNFECPPVKFEFFLTVLGLVDGVNEKTNFVAETISHIKTLNLKCSDLHKQKIQLHSCDVINLCKYLKYFKSLESINMIGNDIEQDVTDALAVAVLKNFSIIKVHIEENPICKVKKCFRLFEVIGIMRTLGNAYPFKDHPEQLEAFVSILRYIDDFDDGNCDITENIEHLDVSWFYQPPDHNSRNRSYGIEKITNPEVVIIGFVSHLRLFCRLTKLNLSHACLSICVLQELAKFLQDNDTLLQLDLSNNNIQAEGALIVLKSLNTNATLKVLKLNDNNIFGKKSSEIAIIICSLNISVYILKGNKLTEESKGILSKLT